MVFGIIPDSASGFAGIATLLRTCTLRCGRQSYLVMRRWLLIIILLLDTDAVGKAQELVPLGDFTPNFVPFPVGADISYLGIPAPSDQMGVVGLRPRSLILAPGPPIAQSAEYACHEPLPRFSLFTPPENNSTFPSTQF